MPDMRLTEPEKKDFALPCPAPKYPYGLRVTLSQKELDKIGMSVMPQIDSEMLLKAKVKVIGISSEREEGDVESHRLELQITEMDLAKRAPEDRSISDVIYGG